MENNFLVNVAVFLTAVSEATHHQTPAFRCRSCSYFSVSPCCVLIVLLLSSPFILFTFILKATDLLTRKVIPGVGHRSG